jgi:hypothetical protein
MLHHKSNAWLIQTPAFGLCPRPSVAGTSAPTAAESSCHLHHIDSCAVTLHYISALRVPTQPGSDQAGHGWSWLILSTSCSSSSCRLLSAACCFLHLIQDLIDSLNAECEWRVVLVPAAKEHSRHTQSQLETAHIASCKQQTQLPNRAGHK